MTALILAVIKPQVAAKPHGKDYAPGVALALCAVGLCAFKLAGWWPA